MAACNIYPVYHIMWIIIFSCMVKFGPLVFLFFWPSGFGLIGTLLSSASKLNQHCLLCNSPHVFFQNFLSWNSLSAHVAGPEKLGTKPIINQKPLHFKSKSWWVLLNKWQKSDKINTLTLWLQYVQFLIYGFEPGFLVNGIDVLNDDLILNNFDQLWLTSLVRF